MCSQPSPKTVICRDCGYELTILSLRDEEIPFHFCERCGGQSFDIIKVEEYIRHHPVQFIKDLLHTKIF